MSKLANFIKGLGKKLASVLGIVAKLVTDTQVEQAEQIVRQAMAMQVDNARRREFAVSRLQALTKLPDSVCRWLVETVLQKIKNEGDSIIDKISELAKDDEEVSDSKDRTIAELRNAAVKAQQLVDEYEAQVKALEEANAKAKAEAADAKEVASDAAAKLEAAEKKIEELSAAVDSEKAPE